MFPSPVLMYPFFEFSLGPQAEEHLSTWGSAPVWDGCLWKKTAASSSASIHLVPFPEKLIVDWAAKGPSVNFWDWGMLNTIWDGSINLSHR